MCASFDPPRFTTKREIYQGTNYVNMGGGAPLGNSVSPPKTPVIPQSTDVRYQSPSYSRLLLLRRKESWDPLNQDQILPPGVPARLYKTTTPSSVYSGSTYAELEAILSKPSRQNDRSRVSPVSSSYSELLQASENRHQPENYSSIYDHLSPYLRNRSSEESTPGEFFGSCAKCSGRIIGEGTGCSALGRIYHVGCFVCSACGIGLQGKPFYALDSKPFCQSDYVNSLEKCCKCSRPIMNRILRATGKPYHPGCFVCVVCDRTLDGIPFTVDATNQIHCIEDFHKRFAPRCSVCKEPIMPEEGQEETVRVVALDKSFHINCYKCEDCGLLLSSEENGRGCYPLDGRTYCKNCNTKRIQDLTCGID